MLITLNRHGNKNEPIAATLFEALVNSKKLHVNFVCTLTGLIVSTTHPYLAASPDRIFTCDCCERGVVEIKCPFSLKGQDVRKFSEHNKNFFLQLDLATKELVLVKSHEYYFQIQLQLFVAECAKAILVVYNGTM